MNFSRFGLIVRVVGKVEGLGFTARIRRVKDSASVQGLGSGVLGLGFGFWSLVRGLRSGV